MSLPDAEVIVVGGGPAGAATAAHLARGGRDVLLLEKGAFPRQKPCGEYYSPGVADTLARLGALDRVLSEEHELLGGMRVSAGGSAFMLSYPEGQGLRRALGVKRYHLDRALLDHARSCGVCVEERVGVAGTALEGGRVAGVRLRGASGEEVLRSRFVVGADGRHSKVARSLGLVLPVRWPRRLGLHAHYVGAVGRLDGLGEMHVGEGAYCGLAPVGGNLVVAGLVSSMGEKPSGEPAARFFDRKLGYVPGAARRLEGARRIGPVRGVGPLAHRVSRSVGPGYLLVGDAAGYLDPFTGEGVHRALRGAELAAEAIENALRAGSALPTGYQKAREHVFADKERLTLLIQCLLGSPRVLAYALGRLEKRNHQAGRIKGALGDYRPAGPAIRPGYLLSLLRP